MVDRNLSGEQQYLSARDLEGMHPNDAKRYRAQAFGKPDDANAHRALEAGGIFHGKGWDFAAPPKRQKK